MAELSAGERDSLVAQVKWLEEENQRLLAEVQRLTSLVAETSALGELLCDELETLKKGQQ